MFKHFKVEENVNDSVEARILTQETRYIAIRIIRTQSTIWDM